MRLVDNVRLCFATNSSSTHSVVQSDEAVRSYCQPCNEDGQLFYGGDHFALSNTSQKQDYIAAMLFKVYINNHKIGIREALSLVKDAFPDGEYTATSLLSANITDTKACQWPMPRLWRQGLTPLVNWLKANVINNNKIHIVGGRSDAPYPNIEQYEQVSLPIGNMPPSTVYIADSITGYITTIDRANGTRNRYVTLHGENPVFSAAPELIDL